ncbi:MAG TPA: multicopper oxidase domain-containing protein, partial [Candidatus Baltobacteraceae bacterium]|nr:multicopper oxidase domain-containing protein [Candidatus Baltobacteraceae bacterium]
MPDSSGIFKEPPSIRVWQVKRANDGLPHVALKVEASGPRYCFRDENAAYEDAPVLRVRPGDRFVLRLINELPRKKHGHDMQMPQRASSCAPMAMTGPKPRKFMGYLNHVAYERYVAMPDEDVNIHLHGFTGPPSQENVFLSSVTSRACDYDITIPRTQIPGTYYYHPHAHGVADDEVAQGLSGMWIVEPPASPFGPDNEHVAILRYRMPSFVDNNYAPSGADLENAATTRIRYAETVKPVAYDPFNPPPWPSAYPMRGPQTTLDRCAGFFPTPQLSIDGVDAPAHLTVTANTPQLLRILNATSDTFANLKMRNAAGQPVPMHIVARDGTPVGGDTHAPYAHYVTKGNLFFADASRADLVLTLQPGEDLTLYSDHACQGPIGEYMLRHDILTIHGGDAAAHANQFASTPLQPAQNRALALVRYAKAHPALVRKRAIAYTEYALRNTGKGGNTLQFFITDITNTHFSEHPFWPS